MMDGMNILLLQEVIIPLSIIQKKGRVVVPHPKKDLPIGTVKSIFKQAQINVMGGK